MHLDKKDMNLNAIFINKDYTPFAKKREASIQRLCKSNELDFICLEDSIKPKQFWIPLLYPMLYFLFFLVTGPLTGFYPYGFMNVAEQGLLTVLKFVVL